ncbi:transcriptional activator DEMETER-like [Dorcoceras hygrometricum]|uniref:Transcriptional activator DEMETER-like n=1 Tax=Dorcoceras hygrometricum TaxID=472368 RepID=A0A2Z7A3U3_9LAMI|nr:transcriptional activator DEMETER-like [Dorcoceras hygrometricum]
MASSLISRRHHVDFDSVFRFDDTGIVQMFETLVPTGFMEFLGCPAIFNEQALIEFFENGSVRDGMVVSTISGTVFEISESVFAAAFPVAGVATEEHIPVKEIATEDADATIRQVLTQLDLVFEQQDDVQGGRVETWFDRAFDEAFVAGDQEDQASESLDHIFLELDTAGQTAGTMEVGESSKQTVASKRSFEKLMSVDDLLVQICDDMMLPSITAAEISKIRIGESFDKGKGLLVEDEPVMADVVDFFHSFSLNKLTDLDALLALKAKEKLMLDWAETDSLETAVKRRLYILAKYREMLLRKLLDSHRQYLVSGQPWMATASQIFDLLSAVHSKSLEALRILQQEHGIIFEQPCTSTAFDYAVDCGAVFVRSLDVQKLPAYLLDDFQRGVLTDFFAGYFGGSVVLSDSEILSDSSSGCTVYRSPSPVENPFALGPAIFSRVDHAEQLYFVQSPVSPPVAFSHQESSSSSSDVSIHFDSEDLPMRTPEAAHTSAPVDSNVSTAALDDLKSYFSQRIDESTTELRSKVNEVEFNVRGDLVKQQAWLRQVFQSACDILERQSTQLNDLKKGLVAPVGTIFQDLFDIKKNQRAHEAKLNALDGQVAALRNDQLEFQNRISADLLSLSTQFADIVEFIRGGDAKKGESGSSSRTPPVRVERRPLPIPPSPRDVAGSSGAVRIPTFPRTTGTFEERVEQARRHLLESGLVISVEEAAERIRQADFEESDRFQRERERARREKRSSSSRRRRGF